MRRGFPKRITTMSRRLSVTNVEGEAAAKSSSPFILECTSTVTKQLVSQLSATVEQLEGIWNQVGLSEEERQTQLEDLLRNLNGALTTKVECEQELRDHFLSDIAEKRGALEKLAERLGVPAPPSLPPPPPPPAGAGPRAPTQFGLSATLVRAEEDLARLEAMKEERIAAVRGVHEEMVTLSEQLGEALEPELQELEDVGVHADALARCETKRAALRDEADARAADIAAAVAECQALMHELDMLGEGAGEGGERAADGPDAGSARAAAAAALDPLDQQILGSVASTAAPVLVSRDASASCVGVAAGAREAVRARAAALADEKATRYARLGELGEQISKLWERLDIGADEQAAFRARRNERYR